MIDFYLLLVLKYFPPVPDTAIDTQTYLKQVDDIYITDAYHSLSIEGYQVTAELIDRVLSGNWSPDSDENDRNQRNALAARGYWQAFQAVKESVKNVHNKKLSGTIAGKVAEFDHEKWYRELFAPSVTAGILKVTDLAGYRNHPVF